MENSRKFKILFIAPYDYNSFSIRTLQTFIKSKGYNTGTIFFKDLIFNQLQKPTRKEKELLISLIKRYNPNIICISLRSPIAEIVAEITKLIKNKVPNSIVIWGGTHATICPEECIMHVDFVCVGEGEKSLLEFIEGVEQNKSVDKIKNFWVKKNGKIIKNELRNLFENLDELPLFDFSSEDKYYIDDDKLCKGDPILERSRYCTLASRGCPFACTFCSNSYLHRMFKGKGNYVRKHSVKYMIDELIYAKKVFKNLKLIIFFDEVFVLDKEWLKEFVREYKQKIGIDFICEFYPSTVNEETIRLLKKAGLTQVVMGIQTGSQRVRYDVFKRFTSDEQILNATRILKECKITTYYDLILDNPYETKEDMEKGIQMLLKIPRPYNLNIYSLINFPKTDLTERFIVDKVIDREDATKALTQWRMSLKFKRSKDHLFYNSLVTLLSKNFVPLGLIKMISRSTFLKKYPKVLVMFANISNKLKIVFTGIHWVLSGKVSYASFKYYYKNAKRIIN